MYSLKESAYCQQPELYRFLLMATRNLLLIPLLTLIISGCSSSSTDSTSAADSSSESTNTADISAFEPNTPIEEPPADDALAGNIPMDSELSSVGPPDDNSPVDSEPVEDDPAGDNSPIESEPPAEDTDLDLLLRSIKQVLSVALVDLNRQIRQGEMLTDQQGECIAAFDPMMGESLLAIDCEQSLAVNEQPLFLHSGAFFDTAACQAGLFNDDPSACELAICRITVPTQFVTGPVESTDPTVFVPERPQPIAGAEISFRIEPDRLTLESNPSALTGVFFCEIDLLSQLPLSSDRPGNCSTELVRIRERLDVLLAAQ